MAAMLGVASGRVVGSFEIQVEKSNKWTKERLCGLEYLAILKSVSNVFSNMGLSSSKPFQISLSDITEKVRCYSACPETFGIID